MLASRPPSSSMPPRPRYEHRQTGWATIVAAFIPLVWAGRHLLPGFPASWATPQAILAGLLALALIVLVNFSSLTTQVTTLALVVRFGIGPFRKVVALDDMTSVEIVRTRWYQGWGIHWTRRGTLYNVSGFDAVRLRLVSGRSVIVGSDDVARLKNAIDRLRAERLAAVRPR